MPRKKVIEEEPEEEYEWDKPRIIIFFGVILFLVLGGLLAKHFFLDKQNSPALQGTTQSVQGISFPNNQDTSSQLPTVQNVQQGVQQEISNLQNQASKISVQDIASSSPQVQQILQEIKQLPQQPGNIAKRTCEQICNSL